MQTMFNLAPPMLESALLALQNKDIASFVIDNTRPPKLVIGSDSLVNPHPQLAALPLATALAPTIEEYAQMFSPAMGIIDYVSMVENNFFTSQDAYTDEIQAGGVTRGAPTSLVEKEYRFVYKHSLFPIRLRDIELNCFVPFNTYIGYQMSNIMPHCYWLMPHFWSNVAKVTIAIDEKELFVYTQLPDVGLAPHAWAFNWLDAKRTCQGWWGSQSARPLNSSSSAAFDSTEVSSTVDQMDALRMSTTNTFLSTSNIYTNQPLPFGFFMNTHHLAPGHVLRVTILWKSNPAQLGWSVCGVHWYGSSPNPQIIPKFNTPTCQPVIKLNTPTTNPSGGFSPGIQTSFARVACLNKAILSKIYAPQEKRLLRNSFVCLDHHVKLLLNPFIGYYPRAANGYTDWEKELWKGTFVVPGPHSVAPLRIYLFVEYSLVYADKLQTAAIPADNQYVYLASQFSGGGITVYRISVNGMPQDPTPSLTVCLEGMRSPNSSVQALANYVTLADLKRRNIYDNTNTTLDRRNNEYLRWRELLRARRQERQESGWTVKFFAQSADPSYTNNGNSWAMFNTLMLMPPDCICLNSNPTYDSGAISETHQCEVEIQAYMAPLSRLTLLGTSETEFERFTSDDNFVLRYLRVLQRNVYVAYEYPKEVSYGNGLVPTVVDITSTLQPVVSH